MAQQQPNSSDQASNFFWMIAIVVGAGIILWWTNEKVIVSAVFWVRIQEIQCIRLFAVGWSYIATPLHLPQMNLKQIDALQYFMQNATTEKLKWQTFGAINVAIGNWVRFPIMLILICLGFWAYKHGAGRFKHEYTMKTLRIVDQELWPQITPVISLDLVKEDIDKGPWAMAQLPLDFSRQHDLLMVKTIAHKKVWVLKQKPAFRLFVLQLGPMWRGLDVLPIHSKALMLVFLARATGQRPLAKRFLTQISASAASGKLDFTGISEELKKFNNHRIIKWLEKRHAYMTTLMASMLEIARSDGVLASAEFLWLKPVDRRLWFVMNTVGRQVSVIEVAGVYAHWKAEKRIGRALKTPMVSGAVDALEESMQTILYVEASEQWHTSSAD